MTAVASRGPAIPSAASVPRVPSRATSIWVRTYGINSIGEEAGAESDEELVVYESAKSFETAAKAAPSRCLVVFDVGSNEGLWTHAMARRVHRPHFELHRRRCCHIHAFDPQPSVAAKLRFLARTLTKPLCNVTYHPVAAWTQNTNLTFYASTQRSVSSSLNRDNALYGSYGRSSKVESFEVEAVDSAEALGALLPKDAISILKLDVESTEYQVLPHLLTSGLLCRLSVLHVEWHLNALPPHQRLSGLSLQKSLPLILREGCRGRPPQLHNEAWMFMNWQSLVPGLAELAAMHNGTKVPNGNYSRTAAIWDRSVHKRYANSNDGPTSSTKALAARAGEKRVANTAAAVDMEAPAHVVTIELERR